MDTIADVVDALACAHGPHTAWPTTLRRSHSKIGSRSRLPREQRECIREFTHLALRLACERGIGGPSEHTRDGRLRGELPTRQPVQRRRQR